jgi:hypothetical protein
VARGTKRVKESTLSWCFYLALTVAARSCKKALVKPLGWQRVCLVFAQRALELADIGITCRAKASYEYRNPARLYRRR